MNRYRIIMRETKFINYEVDAYNIDDALAKSHNWAEQDRDCDENDTVIKIELIKEE